MLVDSGSSIHAADLQMHFPGATLKPTDEASGSFHTATGAPFAPTGQFDVSFRTDNNHNRSLTFLNAPVSMPIMSVNRWNKWENRTIFEDEYGLFVNKATGRRISSWLATVCTSPKWQT